jgi:PTH1 family peptidyl-tRNA hydrolase
MADIADIADRWLVAGLGNPGPGYAANRHNVGQQALGVLASRSGATFAKHKANAVVASAGPLLLAKPNTFMNLSGGPVAALLRFYKIPPARLIVVHDELDLPFDTLRLKLGGGHGGHNGLRDIIAAIGTGDFIRVRVGIGRPPGRQDAADFVLHDFTATERKVLPTLLEDAADAVSLIASDGLTAAQLKFHTAPPAP